jgi:uncharacterized membrane protein YjfL (UPF0719 family)
MDGTFDARAVMAGVMALAVAVVTAVILVFLLSRANALITHRLDVEGLLREGQVGVAISAGAILLCQAILVRHAVFPVMAGARDLMLSPFQARAALAGGVRAALIVTVITAAAYGSVALASLLFTRMTGSLDEHEEIRRNNVAVAVFHAFVLLAITAVLNEGIEDLARSLVPYGRTGIITIE